jgi:hypothetical protein
MSDLNIYADQTAIDALPPITGDVVLRASDNAVLLYNGSAWKEFQPDAGPGFSNQYSVSLDGSNDYIDCGGDADFSFTDGAGNDSAFSVSAWVKFDSITRARIISKDVSTGSREYLFGTNNANKVNMILGTGSVNLDIQNNTAINTTAWFHIVATYDGSKSASGLKVYVNADASSLSDNSVGSYSGMASTIGNLEFGRFANGHSFFNGLMDDVAVFDYELTEPEVAALRDTSGSNPVPANISSLSPVGWWRMGENDGGTGSTITDKGSGGNDATLMNGADIYSGTLDPNPDGAGPDFSSSIPS